MAKIIDEKGRIFGLINVIDLFVMLVLVLFVPIALLGYKAVNWDMISEREWLPVKIRLSETEIEYNDVIRKGDLEKDAYGKTIAEITSVSMNPLKVWILVDNKMLTTIDHPDKKEIVIELSLLCVKKGGAYYYKATPVKIGKAIGFSTEIYSVSGTIIGMKRQDKKLL